MKPDPSPARKDGSGRPKARILIAAGGSGGHIFPAVALARALKAESVGTDIRFVGSNKALDIRIFEKEDFSFSLLSSNKLPYAASPRLVIFFIKLLADLIKGFFIILGYGPDVVVGFGGYVSFPIVFVSCLLGIPRIVHEQNVMPGRANRFLFKLADKIAVSFEDTKKNSGSDIDKTVFTGNPIRPDISSASVRADQGPGAAGKFGLAADKFTILVIGGSQGSHFLNESFINAVAGLDAGVRSSLQVIHITGIKDYEWAADSYGRSSVVGHRVYSFIDRIEEAYAAADLIVTRSGASALFEIALFAKPMILVPYPFAMSHQAENAKVFSRHGAAIEMDEGALSVDVFKDAITALLGDRPRLKNMGDAAKRLSVPGASRNLADLVLRYADR